MRLAYIHIPRFALAVEARLNPQLLRAPAIVYDHNHVLETSPGLDDTHPGESLRKARAAYPHAIFVPATPLLYRDVSETLLRALELIGPRVELVEQGCAYVDIGGLDGHYADAFALAGTIVDAVRDATGLLPSVGIADGKLVAHVAARLCTPGDAGVVPAGRERDFLRDKSVTLLPVAPEIIGRLQALALHTLGDIAALAPAAVAAQFGRAGTTMWELANGIDPRPLQPRAPVECLVEQLTFDAPVATVETLVMAGQQLIRRLLDQLGHKSARRMHIQLSLDGGLVWERLDTFRGRTSDEPRIMLLLKTRLAALALTSSVDTMTITLDGIGSEVAQQKRLMTDTTPQLNQVAEAVRQLRVQYRRPVIWRAVEVDPCSRHPEERVILIPYDA